MLLLYRFAVIVGSKKKSDDDDKSQDSFMTLGEHRNREIVIDPQKRVSVVSEVYRSNKTTNGNRPQNGRNGHTQRPTTVQRPASAQRRGYEYKLGGL